MKFMNKITLIQIVMVFGSSLAFAGADTHHEEIPWSVIGAQAFNFFLLVGILVWLVRKPVAQMFAERSRVYTELVGKADAAKNEAEKNKTEIALRLKDLEDTTQSSLEEARTEAQALHERMKSEAEEISRKAKADAELAVQFEIEKAKQAIREELLNIALDESRTELKKSVGVPELKKLQGEFVDKIQAVR